MSVNAVDSNGNLKRVAGGTLYADLPIGSWVKNDSNTLPSGFLKAGDTISQELYPELYAMYGSTVPYKADTSELSDYESITLSTDSNNPTIMLYDGFITSTAVSSGNGAVLNVIVNNSEISFANTYGTYWKLGSCSATVKKGDSVYITTNGAVNVSTISSKVAYYKKSLIVKAKQVAVPADFIDAINDVLKVSEPVSATNTEYTINGSIVWKRSGNVVEVTFLNVAFASQTSGDVTLATGLPPSNNYSWSVIKSLTDTSVQQGVAVNTNGNLTSIGGSTGGSSYYDSFTYLAAD